MNVPWTQRSPGQRLLFGVLLVLSMAMAALIQYAVAALAPFLVVDLGLTRTQIGVFTSVMFVAAAVSSPVLGRLVDRVGTRTPLMVHFALGAIATIGLTSARSYAWLLAIAALAGLPMALSNPITNQLVRQTVPAGSRGLLMGVKQSGVKVGQLLAGTLLPAIALWLGWRAAAASLLVFSVLGAVIASATSVGTRAVTAAPRRTDAAESDTMRLMRLVGLYAFFMGAGQAAVGAYLPLYAFEAVGVSVTAAGATASAMGAAGIVARVGWARPAEHVRWIAVPLIIIALASIVAVFLLKLAESGPSYLVFAGAFAFGASAPVWNVVAMLAILRRVGEHATGRATSILFVGFSAGFIVGPTSFGALVDGAGRYGPGWWLVGSWFGAAAVVATVAIRVEREVDSGP